MTREPDVTAIVVLALLFGLGWSAPVEAVVECARCDAALAGHTQPQGVDLELDFDLSADETLEFGVGPIRFGIR